MATTAEYASTALPRSHAHSLPRSPDTASPIYPDRAIRPLPRSRLKSKLSPEQASSIVYPPEPPPLSPALNFNVPENGVPHPQLQLTNGDANHHSHHVNDVQIVHDHCTCGEDGDSGDEEVEFDHPDYRYSTLTGPDAAAAKPVDSTQRRLVEVSRAANKPPPPDSNASSADGYESFENTSNKKKRKIPLSTASSVHQSQLSAEMASMGINNLHGDGLTEEDGMGGVTGSQAQQQSLQSSSAAGIASSGTGISGAGRGRYGRQDARHRRPLGTSNLNTVNNYASRALARGSDAKGGAGIENTGGIISQAIKTAAEQGPLTPAGKGRENASLLQSATSGNSSTTPKTQFTFTCESDSASKMVDQQAAEYAAGTPTPSRTGPPSGKAQGTQTIPPIRTNAHAGAGARPLAPQSNGLPVPGTQPQAHAAPPPPPPPPKPRPRRNPSKEYALQAANRKKQQQSQNYRHRPKAEDMWICEFCEYEDIYGAPPYAMIRRYEIKDRQERKQAAERRRLLEKAKMKGRKNKKGAGKGNKNSAGNTTNNHTGAPPNSQHYDPDLPPPSGDDYYDDGDEYGDEYEPVGADDQYPHDYYPPPAPVGTPATTPAEDHRAHAV